MGPTLFCQAKNTFVRVARGLGIAMLACACSSSKVPTQEMLGPMIDPPRDDDAGIGLAGMSPMPWSPDGRYVVIDLGIVDTETGTVRPSGCRNSVSWGSNSRFACRIGNDGEQIMEVDDLAAVRQERLAHCSSGEWSGTGHWFACARANTVLDVDTFATIPLPLPLHYSPFLGEGPFVRLDTAPGAGQQIQLWSLESKTAADMPYGSGTGVRWLSPNGRFELWFVESRAYVTDVFAGTHRLVADDASTYLKGSTPFAPDSREVAIPIEKGAVRRIDVTTGKNIATLLANGCEDAWAVAFSPRGDVIALGTSAPSVCIFDRLTNEILRSWPVPKPVDPGTVDTPVGILDFAGGGDGLVVGHLDYPGWSGSAALYRASGELLADLGSTLTSDIQLDASGTLRLSCARVGRDLEVRLADPDGPRSGQQQTTCIGAQVESLPVIENPDGPWFDSIDPTHTKVLGTVQRRATIWSLKTGKVLFSR